MIERREGESDKNEEKQELCAITKHWTSYYKCMFS